MKKQLLFVVSIVLTATLYAQNIPSYVPTNGLVGWWPFNGNANDESGNGNNGVETNINYSQDRNLTNSKSLQLNGNSYVTISNTSTFQGINNQLTICGWFKPTSFFSKNQLYSVICKANNFSPLQFSIQAFPTGVNFLNNGVAYQYLKTINVNTWYFFAITQNQKSVTFYINDSNFTQPNPGTYNYTYSTNNNIEIGRDLYGATEYSTGSTDDIAIYNRALTQQEITSLYTGVPLCNTPNASITPQSSTSFCQGGNVVLNATTGANYTYQWYNNGLVINNANLSSYNTSTNGNYTVTITDGACNASSKPTTVTVNPLPIAKITPQGKIPFCQGSSVDLVASGGISYLWNNGSTSTTVVANKADAYYVDVFNSYGCKSIAWLDVKVDPIPTATITPQSSTTFCQGGNVVLNTIKSANYTYQWYNNGQIINNSTLSSYTTSTNGNYTVTITDGACNASSLPTSVTVNPLPIAKITPQGKIPFCQGSSVDLVASGGISYLWNNGSTSTTVVANKADAYYVDVFNSYGCKSIAWLDIMVNPIPNATITPLNSTNFCQGDSVNLNTTSTANYTYQWLNNGAPISAATTATYKATTTGKYNVIVKNNSGCIDTSSVVTVTVTPTPSLPILTGPATLCYNSKAIFKASIAGGTWGVANDYLLISSPQGLFRNNKMPPSNLYKTGVTYTLKSPDQLCSVTAQKSVWIRNVAATSVTLTAPKQTLKVGEEVAATATTKITGNLLYWLSASSSFVSVAGTSSPYIAIVKGLRPVTGANITFSIDDLSKGCRNAAFLPFTVTVAASMMENETNTSTNTTDLNVYPNPSNGIVNIENIGEAKTISLIDVTGRVLKTTAVNADRMRLDYSTITKGNYFISIQGENLKEMKSIAIE